MQALIYTIKTKKTQPIKVESLVKKMGLTSEKIIQSSKQKNLSTLLLKRMGKASKERGKWKKNWSSSKQPTNEKMTYLFNKLAWGKVVRDASGKEVTKTLKKH